MGWFRYIFYALMVIVPLLIAVALYCTYFITHYRDQFKKSSVPQDFNLPYINFTVKGKRNALLAGWYIPAKNPKGIIIASHGIADSKYGILSYIAPFIDAGFSIVCYDMRHHKDSTGKFCSLGYWESYDLERITAFVNNNYAENLPIFYWGFSLGATVSLLAAANSKLVTAVIAHAPFVSTRKVMAHYISKLYHLPAWLIMPIATRFLEFFTKAEIAKVDILQQADKLSQTPVLIIGSTDDKQVPITWLEDIENAIGSSAELLIGPYGHKEIVNLSPIPNPERKELVLAVDFLLQSIKK